MVLGRKDINYFLNFPLIGNASGVYFIGIGFSDFATKPKTYNTKTESFVYATLGWPYRVLDSRIRLNFKCQKIGKTWGGYGGFSLNICEY